MDLGFEIQKTNFGIRCLILKIPCVPIFRQSLKIWSKIGLWFEIQKTNAEIRISILEIPCVLIFRQKTLTFLARFCPKVNLELEIQKTSIGITISILEIPCVKQNKQLWLFEPKFAQKWIVGVWIWKHTYVVSQFSVKMDSFEFFGLKLRKLPNYVWYFGSNIVEGVAESWVETEMSWVEVNGAG